MGGGLRSFSGSSLADLSCGKTTLLGNLSERRDSTSSTLSSVYTLSRRSSGISPCYSSRRSSQTSQFGANRPGNVSSADSYDPISADISRRSSQVSQCGEGSEGVAGYGGMAIPSPLSLTPAQHYRLKAKYAAATGGVPPTPLPYMDQMCRKTQVSLHGDSQYSSYGTRSLMPHEVPANIPRRASDPVRRLAIDSQSLPQMQRHNSIGTLNRTNHAHPPSAEDRRHLTQHGRLGLVGSPHRYAYSLQPPRILENIPMETISRDIPEENQMPPGDLTNPNRQQHMYSQRDQSELATVNTNINLQTPDFPQSNIGPTQHQAMSQSLLRNSKTNFPPHSGRACLGQMGTHQHQHRRGATVLQHNQNFGCLNNNIGSDQQVIQHHGSTAQQKSKTLANLNEGITFQNRFGDGIGPYDKNGNTTYPLCNNVETVNRAGASNQTYKHEAVDMETADISFAGTGFQHVQIKTEDYDGSLRTSGEQNSNMSFQNPVQTGNQSYLQPRPPDIPKSTKDEQSAPRVLQHTRHLINAKPGNAFKITRSGVLGLDCSGCSKDNTLYYTGQIKVFEPTENLDIPPVVNVSILENALSPNSADNHGQASRTDCSTALEPVQIDFDSMLDDGDHSSIMSGTLSPSLLQSLSQSSSRLTTPRNSVTLPPAPVATGNMAVGDMSSLLTALAEESKFLNLMS